MKTLYQELGEKNIKELVNGFYERVYASDTISHLFTNNIDEVKHKQYCFLTQFFGGPQLYSSIYGPPRMRRRHLPHEITIESKEEWLSCMKKAIDVLAIEDELKAKVYGAFPILAQHMVNR